VVKLLLDRMEMVS